MDVRFQVSCTRLSCSGTLTVEQDSVDLFRQWTVETAVSKFRHVSVLGTLFFDLTRSEVTLQSWQKATTAFFKQVCGFGTSQLANWSFELG